MEVTTGLQGGFNQLDSTRQLTPVPVGGINLLSTVDWPNKITAVVYLVGCTWRCPYCHNPEFVKPAAGVQPWEDVLKLLIEREGFLDGVVFSGGEPTMHPGLAEALRQVRGLGFQTGLHTGGNYPDRLGELLDYGLLDWVGFDVKGPFEDYPQITGQPDSGRRARLSQEILVRSGVKYELRTTNYRPGSFTGQTTGIIRRPAREPRPLSLAPARSL